MNEPATKRCSPWDDVFRQDSEDSLEDYQTHSRLTSSSSNETPKTNLKRQRIQSKSLPIEKTSQLLSLLRSRVSRSLSEHTRLSVVDKDKDLDALVLQVQKLLNDSADPLVKDGNGICALQYMVILFDCPPAFENLYSSSSAAAAVDAILGGNLLDLCLASKRSKCVEVMVAAGNTPILPPLYRSCCVVQRLKPILAIDTNNCNPATALCEVCASFFSSRRHQKTAYRSKWSDTVELAPSILSFLSRSKRHDLLQLCKDNLSELCSSGELGVLSSTYSSDVQPHNLSGCCCTKPRSRRAWSCWPNVN
jgi:hypothetical protein